MRNIRAVVIGVIVGIGSLANLSDARADVTVDRMFSDHMVLQRGISVPVWGTADAGEKVSVTFGGQKKETIADQKGKWTVKLDPLKVGKPAKLTVSGKTSVAFDDVLVGEVWIGSGQSNMNRGVNKFIGGDEVLAKLVKAAPYPNLRLYRGGWKVAAEKDIRGFSALMFSFGQSLQKELDVPVGLIVGAVSGTPSGRWLSGEMLLADPGVKALLEKSDAGAAVLKQVKSQAATLGRWQAAVKQAKAEGKPPPERAKGLIQVGDLYAHYIAPVVPYAIAGVLWDQGEHNVGVRGVDQFTMMGALIRGWRKAWGRSDFPFLHVQKPSGGGCAWDPSHPVTHKAAPFAPHPAKTNRPVSGLFRELHISISRHPNTAMVTTSDLAGGLHPAIKSGYGRRACRVALGFVYGREGQIYGPTYKSHKIEGSKIRIRYEHVGKGLAFRGGEKLQGFEIAGADDVYYWADAKIDGDTVVVSSDKTPKPFGVRYGCANHFPWANLFNKDGLPALTFRTAKPIGGRSVLARPRIIATTDGEIDDRCSMVRFLMYANEWNIEGIIYSSSGFHCKGKSWAGTKWIEEDIDQYAAGYENLKKHDPAYPTPEALKKLVYIGNIDSEGEMTKVTPGSQRIVKILLD
ncbi:MAG: DUF1593 domain-containing protein, partial [Planctomycetes bacterium]|nr:DUF1593 domain-containing protein [Planctomycetota bacterium]